MRLWSLHPELLDAKGLVALWRETLLAQKVLAGNTKGYRNHPQLIRFKRQPDSLAAIGTYLRGILREAERRGYHFDASKIISDAATPMMSVSRGQLEYELAHLQAKLKTRDPSAYASLLMVKKPQSHPLFDVVEGAVEEWEIV